MVDVLDIVSCLLAALPPLLGASRKQWESALERAAPEFLSRRLITLHARNDGALVFSAHAQITLMDVIRDGFLGGTLQVHLSGRKVSHRVAVFDSLGRVTDIASQSDVIRFLAVTPHAMGVLGNATLDQLHMGHARDGGVAQVTRSVPTVEALMFMTSRGVSSVAVVDDSGCLWGNLSASDLRGIAGSDLQLLARPVEEFLSMSIPRRGGALVTVTADSTLRTAVCRLAASHVHRVYMVDKAGRPVGIITCTDVLAALLQGDQLEGASVIAARMVVGAPRPVHRGPV
jgi:CBS domain-containing protein